MTIVSPASDYAMKPSFHAPRSQSALKTRALKMRKVDGSLTHVQALELASTQAGYSNWTHARRVLPEFMKPVVLICPWSDDETQESGFESISYPLPWSAEEIVQLKLQSIRVSAFSLGSDSANELRSDNVAANQFMARYWLDQALRELMFMEATSLVPRFFTVKAYPHKRQQWQGNTFYEAITPPGNDHSTLWQDPETKRYLIVDEPYANILEMREGERATWCEQHGFRQMRSSWGGTYLAPRTAMTMFTSVNRGVDLEAIEKKLQMLPDDFNADDWKGKTLMSPIYI
jgi:hypothetical protein